MTSRVDRFYVDVHKNIQEDRLLQKQKESKVDETGLLWSKERLYVLEEGDIRSSILTEFQ